MKKLLITGASGMMGSDIVPILEKRFKVYPTDQDTLDISDEKTVEDFIRRVEPDWVIHLAALTDLEYCERNPNIAEQINGTATGKIAHLVNKYSKKMVYISTSGVFSGSKKSPYTEDDTPHPVTAYGKSKLSGEKNVAKHLDGKDYLILRAGWLFGGGGRDKKFVGKMFNLMSRLESVRVVGDIIGSPNYSVDIGYLLTELIELDAYGLFHAVNNGVASRYDIAMKIKEFAGFNTQVLRATADEFPTIAPRPPMEAILGQGLSERYNYSMRTWQEALADYIHRLCDIHNNCNI